jgi:hypothetical protein
VGFGRQGVTLDPEQIFLTQDYTAQYQTAVRENIAANGKKATLQTATLALPAGS